MEPFIAKNRTIIPNLDMPQTQGIKRILERTAPLDEIGAYHLGSEIFEGNTVPQVVGLVREYMNKPIIYDALPHQIDDDREAERIVKYLRNEGIQAVTIFPLAGRDVMERWIQKSREYGLEVIIGGHPSTYSSWENSYLGREGIRRLYADACLLGATHFIVPATQPTFKPICPTCEGKC